MRNTLFLVLLLIGTTISAQQNEMTLEDAVWGCYSYLQPEILQGLSWKNDAIFSYVKNDTLWTEEVKDAVKTALVDLSEINNILNRRKEKSLKSFPAYSWITGDQILMHSNNLYCLISTREKKLIFKVILPENAENVFFSKAGSFFSFTKENDIYISDINGKITRITKDGGNGIVNGKTVHRNEFGISKGIFNSPEGNFIAFYRKDETMVADYPIVDFMMRMAENKSVKYPMAGKESHHVEVGIYNISSEKTIFLETGGSPDHYLTNISWSPDETFICMAELNREQNHMQLNCYDIVTGAKISTMLEEKNEKYVEPLHPVLFSKSDKEEFYYISRQDGWSHVYKYDTDGQIIRQITKGEWEVIRILGSDKTEKYLFIEANKDNFLERHIYRININSGKAEKLSNIPGIHQGLLSPEGNFILDNYNAKNIPLNISLISSQGKLLRNVHIAKNPLENYKLGENRLVDIKSADGKYDLTGRLILPENFDPAKKYPVIVYVYGGPHSQLVNKGWHNNARWWQYYMASKGYIAFTMDNRGTNNRGRDFETTVHRRLGVLETEDQMKGIEYLKSLPFVDKQRIGVHGWSYGGFMTLNLMLRHPETFKVGVAGGPVVAWSLYEVMYGERYMDRPQENPDGYEQSKMTNYIANLKGKLMIIHGSQDDVVVMQNSMKFLRECIIQGKQVDYFTYPTHPHNVRGKDRVHLMEKVSNYFFEYL